MGAEPARVPVRDPAVVARWAGAELVLLDTRTGVYRSTNEVGARVWALLDGRRGVAEVVQAVCQDYPADAATARRDVETLLAGLARAGLLIWTEEGRPAPFHTAAPAERDGGPAPLRPAGVAMTAEEVVIALARAGLGLGPGVMPARTGDVEWPAVLALADRHGVAPLLSRALAAAPVATAPPAVLAGLAARLRDGAAAGLLREHALGHAFAVATGAGVEILVLKGAALAHTLYPRPELRPYADLDLLCRTGEGTRLHRALVAAGYAAADPSAARPPRRSAVEGSPECAFSSPVAGVRVEVHVGILEFGLLERGHAALWAAARTVEADGRRLRTLAPAHQVLHLAAHAHRHGYRRLLWIDDLALAVHRWRAELDWPAVVRLARAEVCLSTRCGPLR